MVTIKIDNDDDFWFQPPLSEPFLMEEKFPNKKKAQNWLETNMRHLQVKYCSSYDGNFSNFACWGSRMTAVLGMFDDLYYQLGCQDGGMINSGNWSIQWTDDSVS